MEEKEVIIQKEKIEITPKSMGKDFKKFIETNSDDYLARLKSEVILSFKKYYEALNNQVSEEQSNQEKLQKELADQMDEKKKNNDEIYNLLSRRKQILLREKEHKYENGLKLKAFLSLYKNKIQNKEENKKYNLISKILHKNKLKKIFKALKQQNLFQSSKDYALKLKMSKEDELKKLYGDQDNQKKQLLMLIAQARERLKHENRKKVQVKLMLDQMVLRGISALNLQAMKLSQDSLKDVVSCDYKKDIDVKYNSMLFPDSKAVFINNLK
jgi:hypothetical protein